MVIKDIRAKTKTIKMLEDSRGEYLYALRLWNFFKQVTINPKHSR